MKFNNSNSPKWSHRKASSLHSDLQVNIHRRAQSNTNPTSPEYAVIISRMPEVLNNSAANKTQQPRSFTRLLDASIVYFTQKKKDYTVLQDTNIINPKIEELQKEKDDLKLENSKLQLALAQAKAKMLVYKNKISSLKNYCKIMEVSNYTALSKGFIKEQEKTNEEFQRKPIVRRKTSQPLLNMSSETEFETYDNTH